MGTGLISAAGPPRTLKSEGVWPGGGRTPRVCPQWVALGGGGGAKLPVRAALWMDVRGDFPPRSESNGLCPPPVHPWGVWGNFCRLWLLGKGAETQIMGAGGGGGAAAPGANHCLPQPPPPPQATGICSGAAPIPGQQCRVLFPSFQPVRAVLGGGMERGGDGTFFYFSSSPSHPRYKFPGKSPQCAA